MSTTPQFIIEHALLEPGEDAHVVGRELAQRAAAQLGATLAYDGTRPVLELAADAGDARHGEPGAAVGAISITHTRTQVFAVAARVARLGVDLVDHDDARLDRIAKRFLPGETAAIERYTERLLADGYDGLARALTGDERAAIARDDARRRARAMCFAATEAGLKALGLGLLDGGVIDSASPVRVADLDPPCFAPLPAPADPLALVLHDVGFSILAIAYA